MTKTEFEAEIIKQTDEHHAAPGHLFRRAPGLYYWVDPETDSEWCIERGEDPEAGWYGEWLVHETRTNGDVLDALPTLKACKEALGIV